MRHTAHNTQLTHLSHHHVFFASMIDKGNASTRSDNETLPLRFRTQYSTKV